MNTANRVLWVVIGLLLLAAGVAGTLASMGRLGIDPDTPILTEDVIGRRRDWDGWAPAVAIAVALLAALLGLLLVRSALRRYAGPTMPDVLLTPEPLAPDAAHLAAPTADAAHLAAPTADAGRAADAGRTVVATTALDHALSRDLEAHGRVRRASAHLTGSSHAPPELHVRLAVAPDTDLTELRSHLDDALARLASTSGVRPNRGEVVVSMVGPQPGRVA